MKIETKYNVGDTVWGKDADGNLNTGKVGYIDISSFAGEPVDISYGLVEEVGKVAFISMSEDQLWADGEVPRMDPYSDGSNPAG